MRKVLLALLFIIVFAVHTVSAEFPPYIEFQGPFKSFEFNSKDYNANIDQVKVVIPNDETHTTLIFTTMAGRTITFQITSTKLAMIGYHNVTVNIDGQIYQGDVQKLKGLFENSFTINFDVDTNNQNGSISVDGAVICDYAPFLKYDPVTKVSVSADRDISIVGITGYTLQNYEIIYNESMGDAFTPEEWWDYQTTQGWVGVLINIATGTLLLVQTVVYYFKLLLVDNGVLIFAAWEALVLLDASTRSRDTITFFRRVVRTHVALINFILQVLKWVVEIASQLVNYGSKALGSLVNVLSKLLLKL